MYQISKQDEHNIVAVQNLLFSDSSYTERVYAFENYLKQFPSVDVVPKHEFIEGMCKREVVFEEGTLATGKIHVKDHMDVMLEGEMIVATPEGFKRLIAPCTMITKAGTKKAGIAIKRTRWLSYHPTAATTREELEAEIVCEDPLLGDIT